MTAPPMQRLHALDGLRAAMMLLGVVLHSAVSYVTVPLADAWPYQDCSTWALFDLLVFGIHLFRMPTFFVMAGFFAAFLHQREGTWGFLRHRARRILLPLAVAWVVLWPIVLAGFGYAAGRGTGQVPPPLQPLEALSRAGLIHLWFLYDLLVFCLVAAVVAPLCRRAPALGRTAAGLMGVVVQRPAGWLVPVAVTALTLLPMKSSGLDTSTAFLPPVRVLVAYGVFFAFGWLLYLRRELVPAFAGRAWSCLAAAALLGGAYLVFGLNPQPGSQGARLLGRALAAAVTWLAIFGLVGLFVRRFDRPRPLQRYLADGAYWIYLVHLPFTIWLPGALAPLDWPAAAKFLVVLGATALVTVGSYALFVRSTWLGAALNGRRLPAGLPRA